MSEVWALNKGRTACGTAKVSRALPFYIFTFSLSPAVVITYLVNQETCWLNWKYRSEMLHKGGSPGNISFRNNCWCSGSPNVAPRPVDDGLDALYIILCLVGMRS